MQPRPRGIARDEEEAAVAQAEVEGERRAAQLPHLPQRAPRKLRRDLPDDFGNQLFEHEKMTDESPATGSQVQPVALLGRS